MSLDFNQVIVVSISYCQLLSISYCQLFTIYISKTFDKVWYKGLIYKMETVGFTGSILRLLLR